ncbi:hypothetical protein [Sphingomonas phyllosphaerae]|uniref:hypothetical protein n=1 Tax=Sphingomonas phyllosphaerae TaxID=257003 RepID=UPI0024134D5F|nr:hypothetical protein [Sphingomonas phyllosphaerae]
MSFQQLDPPLPGRCARSRRGLRFHGNDYGQEHNLIWVTALNETGEIWVAPNPRVLLQANWTVGRAKPPAVATARDGAYVAEVPLTAPLRSVTHRLGAADPACYASERCSIRSPSPS